MMMNRERLGFWIKLVAVVLALFFVLSSVLLGLGTNVQYNLLELLGNNDQPQQANQTPQPQDQIATAEKRLEENPKDPDNIKELAALYYQEARYDEAAQVLEKGKKAAPKDAEIPAFLGQVYSQQAQATPGKEQKKLQKKAGDSFAAATEVDPKDEQAYLLAGQAYEQADEPAEAIKYYNGYLDREPRGQDSEQVKERISALLEGETTTGGG